MKNNQLYDIQLDLCLSLFPQICGSFESEQAHLSKL